MKTLPLMKVVALPSPATATLRPLGTTVPAVPSGHRKEAVQRLCLPIAVFVHAGPLLDIRPIHEAARTNRAGRQREERGRTHSLFSVVA
jgi:hypothetical protein